MRKPFSAAKRQDKYTRSVTYAVNGFWSGDNVRVYQSRDYRDGKWSTPEINWSYGGRDKKQEADDVTAVSCFAKAMMAAVKVARKWQTDTAGR